MPTLLIDNPDGDARRPWRFALQKDVVTLGASPVCDIVLPQGGLPDHYAHLVCDGEKFVITTLDRKNPLIVDGQKERKHSLRHRDEFSIGPYACRFLLYDETDDVRAEREQARRESALSNYRKIVGFARELMGPYTLEDFFGKLMDEVMDITRADKGLLVLQREERLQVIASRFTDGRRLESEDALPVSDSIMQKVFSSGESIIVLDASTDTLFGKSKSVSDLKLKSVMAVPLVARGEVLGLIYVGNDKIANLFEEDDLQVLEIFAGLSAPIVMNAMLMDELKLEVEQLEKDVETFTFGSIIGGEGERMQRVFATIEKVAHLDINVLITGETGTGKELIAREIHKRSARRKGEFVAVNCSAIPENLFEDTFFGHLKGAFTGANADAKGKFHAADGGTLFLDEIGDMPISFQPKLLRVLQDQQFYRLGGNKIETVDVRIICATNQHLERYMESGQFREDLYFRINEIEIEAPPLRERGEDIEYLTNFFLKKFAKALKQRQLRLSREALIAIKKCRWPGNVRQLENKLKRAVVMAESNMLGPEDLDLENEAPLTIKPLEEARNEWQKSYIREILALNGGNKAKTAKDLDVHPRTIYRILDE